MAFADPSTLPALTAAQNAQIGMAVSVDFARQAAEAAFERLVQYLPLTGVNQYGFTLAQMQSGLGASVWTEIVNAATAQLTAIAALQKTTLPALDNGWSQRPGIRGYYATLGVTIPAGF